ncbi:MAG: TIGR04255 family protein [Oscillospiraceae bacterium]|nr:TIGR04255 family protein [Oscillospiraceae bacterium]
MFFAEYDRYDYVKPPLLEVICQLRFPSILSIGATAPVAFQEAIRQDFPRYEVKEEQLPPKVSQGPNPTLQSQPPVTNYNFISQDGFWKINLTNSFIALSTRQYRRWEDFAARLDKPLAQFIDIYHPAFFERIGLRYVNAFSRKVLGLKDALWDDLIQPAFLGVLGEPDVVENSVTKNLLNVEMNLSGGYHLKLSTGPGLLGGGKQDPEVKYILDNDLSRSGKEKEITAEQVPEHLEKMHVYAVRVFRGAITQTLHNALGATPKE